jgi:hypothetical protein
VSHRVNIDGSAALVLFGNASVDEVTIENAE